MRIIISILILLAVACRQQNTSEQAGGDTVTAAVPAPAPVTAAAPADTVRITGDFNGDGITDTAFSVLFAKAVEENTQDQYIIRFTGHSLPHAGPEHGRQRLVNEGDLNGDGADEISLFGEPLDGCVYIMQTLSFHPGYWSPLTDPWLIPTACEYLSGEDLQQRIFLENGTLFHLTENVNDKGLQLMKRRLPLRQ